MSRIIFLFFLCSYFYSAAQHQKDANGDMPLYENHFHFSELINLEHIPLPEHHDLTTCWSFSGNSFFASEMMRMGKYPQILSDVYVIRNILLEKARNYVLMHGAVNWNDGAECHDMLSNYTKYGSFPAMVYPSKHYISDAQFTQMFHELSGILHAAVSKGNDNSANAWEKDFTETLNHYLGFVPDNFQFDGHSYTPFSFARRKVGIRPEDYIELTSFTKQPLYKKVLIKVPDNWAMERAYNVKIEDLTSIIDYALTKGYTVLWSADVTEKFFSTQTGVAYVPYVPYDEMTPEEKENMFAGPQPERNITPEMRQAAFENYQTGDEHCMHIIGLAEDLHHKKYYKVKSTREVNNGYGGYCYVTKAFVQYKTISILLHKSALTTSMRNKLNLGIVTEY
jgi:bleomycin hydrolase